MAKYLKKDLREFIKEEEEKQVQILRNRRDEEIKAAGKAAFKDDIELFLSQKEKLEEIFKIWDNGSEIVKSRNVWSNPLNSAYNYLKITLGELQSECLTYGLEFDEKDRLFDKYGKEIDQVRAEFNKVAAILRSKNAKQGAEFLTELGYDISHLAEEEQIVSLTTTIDTGLLGLDNN